MKLIKKCLLFDESSLKYHRLIADLRMQQVDVNVWFVYIRSILVVPTPLRKYKTPEKIKLNEHR